MIQNIAEGYFQGKERFNCAQAVLKTFQQTHCVDDSKIDKYKKMGGGRAENGLCGALYSAKELVDEQTFEKIESDFIDQAGSNKCREIRKLNQVHCIQCVSIAAELVDLHGKHDAKK